MNVACTILGVIVYFWCGGVGWFGGVHGLGVVVVGWFGDVVWWRGMHDWLYSLEEIKNDFIRMRTSMVRTIYSVCI